MNQQVTFRDRSLEISKMIKDEYLSDAFSSYELKAVGFIKRWLSGEEEFVLKTSGSTGVPKEIRFTRPELEISARRTIDFFKLNDTDVALVCVNIDFIGGLMMMVRSLLAGMDMVIIEPSSDPFNALPETVNPSFAALVPLQLGTLVDCYPKDHFKQAKGIIVGGALIDPHLESQCQDLKVPLYHTFGMTETASHIALRKINGTDRTSDYQLLPGWKVAVNDEDRLLINWGQGDTSWITTNDVIELTSETSFRWLGRVDTVINSGGVKIHPEVIEKAIAPILQRVGFDGRYFIGSLPDASLGEKVVLFYESGEKLERKMLGKLKQTLPRFHEPKELIRVEAFRETPTGKIDRLSTIDSYYLNR